MVKAVRKTPETSSSICFRPISRFIRGGSVLAFFFLARSLPKFGFFTHLRNISLSLELTDGPVGKTKENNGYSWFRTRVGMAITR